jgi:uncharacterized protein YndB with AHSA1/START domain
VTELLGATIEHATLIRANPEEVYDAVTTADGLDGWFTAGATVDARPGGKIWFRWKDWGPDRLTVEDGGPVLEAQRPVRFVFQWGSTPTTVELDFKPHREGTIVRVREYGFRNTPAGLKSLVDNATGWGEALTLLKFYVEHGIRY